MIFRGVDPSPSKVSVCYISSRAYGDYSHTNFVLRKYILHINTEDVVVTRKLVEAGELLDVGVLDHIIIGRQSFVSLKDRGLGF